ncbi:MAG: hypothetical protein ACTSUN_01390, partial [Promethearchaeota archaeon]
VLLNEPSITAIQWVPGAGEKPSSDEKWMPIYKKIQVAGKSIIVDNPGETPASATYLYNVLDPKYLIMPLIFLTEMQAAYYLPEFVGGNGAKSDFKQFKREFRKRQKAKQEN